MVIATMMTQISGADGLLASISDTTERTSPENIGTTIASKKKLTLGDSFSMRSKKRSSKILLLSVK